MKPRRYLTMVVVLAALLVLVLPFSGWAQFTYTTNNGAITITGYTGSGYDVTIPSAIDGYPVTAIGTKAFYNKTILKDVTIPNSITSIGDSAFQDCYGLTNVTLPDSVTSIDSYAFMNCSSLASVTIPNSVTNIGSGTFQGCTGVTNLTIGNNVTSIGYGAFFYCTSLMSITIPASVTNIGNGAFADCSGLTNIAVNVDNPNYSSAGGVLFNKTMSTLLQCPGGQTGSYTIPNVVASIADLAFEFCSGLTSVVIPDSVASIGERPFVDCSGLTNIAVNVNNPNYSSVGGVLFNKTLTTLIEYPEGLAGDYSIPNTVTSIGDDAFQDCFRLTSVTIPDSAISIGSAAFMSCSGLTNVMIGNNVANIGLDAFWYCSSLMSITIPVSVTNIGSAAFNSCFKLTSMTIPNNITSIRAYTFGSCSSLTNVTIPAGVISIGDGAFNSCFKLTSITIPNSVTSIDGYAFESCSGLTNVTIPASVTNIGVYAFSSCTNLHQAHFQWDAPSVNGGAGSMDTTMFLGESGTAFYFLGTAGWGATFGGWPTESLSNPAPDFVYATNNGVITITGYAGEGGVVFIPSNINGFPVTSIGDGAFSNKDTLTSLAIPDSVTNIGEHAIIGCSGLTNIAVNASNSSYTSAGGVLFNKAVTTLIKFPGGLSGGYAIPNGVTNIGNAAFENCSRLTSVTIPGSVTSIGVYAFSSCTNLHQAYFQGNAPSVNGGTGSADSTVFADESGTVFYYSGATGWGAVFGGWPTAFLDNPNAPADFSYATNNGTITITGYVGDGRNVIIPGTINDYLVTAIGTRTFSSNNITSVMIPYSVTNIGFGVFEYCYSLTNIAVYAGNQNYASSGGVLFNKAMTALVQYPAGLVGSYTIPDGVTSIGNNAFGTCKYLSNVYIPSSVTNINGNPFEECVTLNAITVDSGNSVYSSVDGVLFNKDQTTLLKLPIDKTYSYTIPSSVTSIGYAAFENCIFLATMAIPNSVTNIGPQAFWNCNGLTSVVIPDSVTSIGIQAFERCYRLTGVTIPDSVTSIGDEAFGYCTNLESVTIGNSVSDIGSITFYYCLSLQQAYFQGNAPNVDGGDGSVDSTVFLGESGTVYYVPGTTGWGATFGGWPTAGWYQSQPQILGSGNGLGAQSNSFGFTISWATNAAVIVEASTNLQNWTPVITNTLVNGTNAFGDSDWTSYSQRFYRVRSQ